MSVCLCICKFTFHMFTPPEPHCCCSDRPLITLASSLFLFKSYSPFSFQNLSDFCKSVCLRILSKKKPQLPYIAHESKSQSMIILHVFMYGPIHLLEVASFGKCGGQLQQFPPRHPQEKIFLYLGESFQKVGCTGEGSSFPFSRVVTFLQTYMYIKIWKLFKEPLEFSSDYMYIVLYIKDWSAVNLKLLVTRVLPL